MLCCSVACSVAVLVLQCCCPSVVLQCCLQCCCPRVAVLLSSCCTLSYPCRILLACDSWYELMVGRLLYTDPLVTSQDYELSYSANWSRKTWQATPTMEWDMDKLLDAALRHDYMEIITISRYPSHPNLTSQPLTRTPPYTHTLLHAHPFKRTPLTLTPPHTHTPLNAHPLHSHPLTRTSVIPLHTHLLLCEWPLQSMTTPCSSKLTDWWFVAHLANLFQHKGILTQQRLE